MKILVINAGSSSVKYQLIDTDKDSVVAKGLCERIGIVGSKLTYTALGHDAVTVEQDMEDHKEAIKLVLDTLADPKIGVVKDMGEIDAVGHRIVHGGEKFNRSAIIDDNLIKGVEDISELAPLHNPVNLMGIRACRAIMPPNTPMVAVFDTAFHQTMAPEAYLYGLPYDAYTDLMIRRYGFHGTSHSYVSQCAIKKLGMPEEKTHIVTCHLGNGSSIAAVKGGKSIDTSMGFTPLEGIAMGTRSGDLDPAIVTYLMEKLNLDIEGISNYLNKESGVYGVSGISSDFRDINIAASVEHNERANLALKMFSYRVKKYIGSYAAAMGGLEAIVFTAGVGENDLLIRELSLEGLEFLGVDLDYEANKALPKGMEAEITKPNSPVKVYVIPTDEEMVIARETANLIGQTGAKG